MVASGVASATTTGYICQEVLLESGQTCIHGVYHSDYNEVDAWGRNGRAACAGINEPYRGPAKANVCAGEFQTAKCISGCNTSTGYAYVHDHSTSWDWFWGWISVG